MDSSRSAPSTHAPGAPPAKANRSGAGRRRSAPVDPAWLEQQALRYVAQWDASAAGVAAHLGRKLARRCQDEPETLDRLAPLIEDVVSALVQKNYINDRRFAENLLAKQQRSGRSKARIRQELIHKGVGEDLVSELLSERAPDEDLDAAWRLAKQKRIGPYCLDAEKRERFREKHLGVLGRAGFEWETALAVIDAAAPRDA